MTITEQLEHTRDSLKPWSDEIKGRVEIAADAFHLLGILATSPGAPRVAVLFDGEEKFGDYEELGKVNRKFIIVVSRGRGFRLNPEDSLIKGVAGGRPLYQLVEQCREMIRSIVFDRETTNGIPDYLGTQRFNFESSAVDAYQINIQILTQLPLRNVDEPAPDEE